MLEAKAKFLEPRSTKCLLKQPCGSGELQDRGGEAALRAQESSPERISVHWLQEPQLCLYQVQARSFLCSYHFFLLISYRRSIRKLGCRPDKGRQLKIGKVSLYYWACLVAQW